MFFNNDNKSPAPAPQASNSTNSTPPSDFPSPSGQPSPPTFPGPESGVIINPESYERQNLVLPTLTAVVNGLAVAKDPYKSEDTRASLGTFGTRILLAGETVGNTVQKQPFDVPLELPGAVPFECMQYYTITEEFAACSAVRCGRGEKTVIGKKKPNTPSNCNFKEKAYFTVDCSNNLAPQCCFSKLVDKCEHKGVYETEVQLSDQSSPPTDWKYCEGSTVTGGVVDTSRTCPAASKVACGEYSKDWDTRECIVVRDANNNVTSYGTKTKTYLGTARTRDGLIPEYCVPHGLIRSEPCAAEDIPCTYKENETLNENCSSVGQVITVTMGEPSHPNCVKKSVTCSITDVENSKPTKAAKAICDAKYNVDLLNYICNVIGREYDIKLQSPDDTCPKTPKAICNKFNVNNFNHNCKYKETEAMNMCKSSGFSGTLTFAEPLNTNNRNCLPIKILDCSTGTAYWSRD